MDDLIPRRFPAVAGRTCRSNRVGSRYPREMKQGYAPGQLPFDGPLPCPSATGDLQPVLTAPVEMPRIVVHTIGRRDRVIRAFDSIKDPQANEIGGKGRSLVLMWHAGFPVPAGFVVDVDKFREHIEAGNLQERICAVLNDIAGLGVKAASDELMQLVSLAVPQDSTKRLVAEALCTLKATHVAVRSSAVSEDSKGSSHAGLHSSVLDVEADATRVMEAVVLVWSSLFTERALVYRQIKNLPLMEGMAVVVQEMISGRVSGVAFTVHPDDDRDDIMVVECASGSGDAVVGGQVTPNRYILARKTGDVVDQTETEPDLITQEELTQVAETCLAVEGFFGYPQDIEWSLDGRGLHVLQSRWLATARR